MKSIYSFEDCGTDGQTDRQTDGIYFGMYSQRPFKSYYMTHLPKLKIS